MFRAMVVAYFVGGVGAECAPGLDECQDQEAAAMKISMLQKRGGFKKVVQESALPIPVPLFAAKMGVGATSAVRISFGTPGETCYLEVDLGSTLLWVVSKYPLGGIVTPSQCSYSPNVSTTATDLQKTGKFVYSTGMAAGNYWRDIMTIDGLNPLEFDFVVATRVAQIDAEINCGIWGVAQGSKSQGELFDALRLPHVMSYTLDNKLGKDIKKYAPIGTMYLGGVSDSQYKGGLACIPTIPKDSPNRIVPPPANNTENDPFPSAPITHPTWWQVEVESVWASIGSSMKPQTSDDNHTEFKQEICGKQQAFFDSGAPFIPGPETAKWLTEYFSGIHFEIPYQGDVQDCALIDRSVLPVITIQMAGVDLLVTPDMYWQTLPETSNLCQWNLLVPQPGDPLFKQLNGIMVIGEMVFGSYVAVFDWDKLQVAVATKAGASSLPELPHTCSENAFLHAD